MNDRNGSPVLASLDEALETIEKLRKVDSENMLDCVLGFPQQIISAIEESSKFDGGDNPLDKTSIHLLGLGGSAIAGDLLTDMAVPRHVITVHRGTLPPRDTRGTVVSSYSGNTKEILEIIPRVIGGLKSAVVITSGGELESFAMYNSIPIWRIPGGFQPRSALGWSIGLLVTVLNRWNIPNPSRVKLLQAAKRLKGSFTLENCHEHPFIRAAVQIVKELTGRCGLVFFSKNCKGAARRFVAQLNENGKHPAFEIMIPEALHNTIEGLGGSDPEQYTLIFITDPADPPMLREVLRKVIDLLENKGFTCIVFPAAGNNPYELTLSRVLLGDFVSLFLAASKEIDPTPIPTISSLKVEPIDTDTEEGNIEEDDSVGEGDGDGEDENENEDEEHPDPETESETEDEEKETTE